ncbi:MAG: asparagine synthase (glutamine-hydrolyzing) [Ginsengibacter sp.]
MCGIAGIIGENKNEIKIETILTRIKHRGPDGLFYWHKENFSLAHARLSVIDLSTNANQPMLDPATGNVIIFNGEIYNYRELKKNIGNRYAFKTESDTEVILAAYAVYGIKFLQHLRGMFALAIYDHSKNKVLCARDRFGIKPFYYRHINNTFVFASEIKAIINLGKGRETVNSLKAYEFMADMQLDTNEETFFEGVLQIQPAHYAWVGQDGVLEDFTRYWDYPLQGENKFDGKAQSGLVELFDETIAFHLRSDVPVGSFLSGGLDSSSVSCFAMQNMKQEKLHTFSGVLPYYHPENILIDDVLAMGDRWVPHKFPLDGNNFFNDIRDVIYHHDEPILDGSMYSHYKLCKLASEIGVKVLLSGSGGDELFGGYTAHINSYQASMLSTFRFQKYLKDLKRVVANSNHTYKNLILKSVSECLPFYVRRILKNRQIKNKSSYLQIHPDIRHFHYEHADPYYANWLNYYKSWSVPPFLHYEDRNSMAFGIETRVPFYDHKLMEYVAGFAPDQLIDGSSKSLIRKSFKGRVPATVLDQKGKFGFPSPIDHALKSDEKGKELFFDLYRNTPLLHAKETEQLGIDFYNGKADLSTFWRVLSYMIWYDIFFTQVKAKTHVN